MFLIIIGTMALKWTDVISEENQDWLGIREHESPGIHVEKATVISS